VFIGYLSSFEISSKEKEMIAQGIIEHTLQFMIDCVNRETSTKRANRFTKSHHQSKTAIAQDTIQYNILTKKQEIPARPRDFRLKLANEEKKIGMSEMTDILSSSPFIGNLLERHDGKYPLSRGRPKSNLAGERRGRPNYYTESERQKIFDCIMKDSKIEKQIDDIVTNHEIFPQFINYYLEIMFKEIKKDEKAFRNSYKPIIINKPLQYLEKNELDNTSNNQWIFPANLNKNKIKELSKQHTVKYKNTVDIQLLDILYLTGFLMYINSLFISH
jgi:hypothetical protein